MKLGFVDSVSYNFVKKKSYFAMLMDGLVGTWLDKRDYVGVVWTLYVELWCSYFVYALAFVVGQYRRPYILFALVIGFLWIPLWTDSYDLSNVTGETGTFYAHMPFFFIGTLFAYMEAGSKKFRPLDKLRRLSPRMTVVKNTLLICYFFFYGGYTGNADCNEEVPCTFFKIVSLNWYFGFIWCNNFAVIALFLLALTSENFQKFLLTKPMQFLGKISYTFYLFHMVFVNVVMFKIVNWMTGYDVDDENHNPNGGTNGGIKRNTAAFIALFFTLPFTILFSWFLEHFVDTPAKDLANEIDQNLREVQTRGPDGQPKKPQGFREFCKTNQKVRRLVIYLVSILVITEAFKLLFRDRAD